MIANRLMNSSAIPLGPWDSNIINIYLSRYIISEVYHSNTASPVCCLSLSWHARDTVTTNQLRRLTDWLAWDCGKMRPTNNPAVSSSCEKARFIPSSVPLLPYCQSVKYDK